MCDRFFVEEVADALGLATEGSSEKAQVLSAV